MKWILLVFLVLLSFIGKPCGCIGNSSIEVALKGADAIFTGEVISTRLFRFAGKYLSDINTAWARYNVFSIKVDYVCKGQKISDTVDVFTKGTRSECGYNFEIGKKYIVYCKREERYYTDGDPVPTFLFTSRCTRTGEFDPGEFKKVKRQLKWH